MRETTIILSLLLLVMATHSPVLGNELVSGKTFLIANGDAFAPLISGFYTNYTNAGNTVIDGLDMT